MLIAGNFDRGLERQPTDLAALLNEAAEDVRPFVQLRKQSFTAEFSSDLGLIDIEPAKIRDCVSHLLLNAVKFTPDMGKIMLTAKRLPDSVEIRISDTGSGIDQACQVRLFEPFF